MEEVSKNIKYIYFEVTQTTGYNSSKKSIENVNALLFRPHTNSRGVWGYANLTERHGFPEKCYMSVDQYWIDLEKYKNTGNDFMKGEIDLVLEKLEELLKENSEL
jgi:hypothetical protein